MRGPGKLSLTFAFRHGYIRPDLLPCEDLETLRLMEEPLARRREELDLSVLVAAEPATT